MHRALHSNDINSHFGSMQPHILQPHQLAKLITGLAVICVVSCFLIAASVGNIRWCMPFAADCVSISATGRRYPEFFVFKGLMLPAAVLMVFYWQQLHHWLSLSGIQHNASNWMLRLGYVAAGALAVYTLTLGATGEPYALARRMGIILFFGLTAMNHLLLLLILRTTALLKYPHMRLYRGLSWSMLLVGLANTGLSFWPGYDDYQNAVEWWFALAMISQFALVGRLWQRSGFRVRYSL